MWVHGKSRVGRGVKKKHPYYRAIPSDFFGSPTVRQMSPDCRAYFRLLHDIVWDYDTQFSIPDDNILISALLGITSKRWQKIKTELEKVTSKKLSTMQGNFTVNGGRIYLGYLKREKNRIDKFCNLQKKRAVKGWEGRSKKWMPRHCHGMPRHCHGMPRLCHPNPKPNPKKTRTLRRFVLTSYTDNNKYCSRW